MKPLSLQLFSLNPLIERGTMQWNIKPRVTCEKIISCQIHPPNCLGIAWETTTTRARFDILWQVTYGITVFHLPLLLWSLLSKHLERFKGIWQTSYLHCTTWPSFHFTNFLYFSLLLHKNKSCLFHPWERFWPDNS